LDVLSPSVDAEGGGAWAGFASAALDGRRSGVYERHRPETTTLYALVGDNFETLYAAVLRA
jgi:hypothetical protein